MSTTEFNNKHRSNEESRQSRYATEKTFINIIHCSSNAKNLNEKIPADLPSSLASRSMELDTFMSNNDCEYPRKANQHEKIEIYKYES